MMEKLLEPQIAKSFRSKVAFDANPDKCWEWKSGKDQDRYGIFSFKIKRDASGRRQISIRAHRAAYFIEYGTFEVQLRVCHHCDNPSCVNPRHLFLGTDASNKADSVRKKRHTFGDRHGRIKILDGDIAEVKRMYAEGLSQKAIASQLGVGQTTIHNILSGVGRRHLFEAVKG